MNLTQNDRLKQVTSDILIVGEGLSFQEEYLSLATPEWDSLLFSGGQRNS